jgi:MtaA/CmuA family methyltransferase
MTSRERLAAGIRGESVDRIPNMLLIKQFCSRRVGVSFSEYNRDHRILVDAQLAMFERWPHDCFNVIGYAYREASDCGLPLVWPEETVPHPVGILVRDSSDIPGVEWPSPWDGPMMRDRLDGIRLFKEKSPDTAVLGWVEGCFAQAVTFHGMEDTLVDLMADPDLVKELMESILEGEAAFAEAQIEAGADVIGIGDAAASLVRPEAYVEHILPFEKELVKRIRAKGAFSKLHICGDINPILDHIGEAGADMVDIDWMVSMSDAREALGPDVCLCGNVDPVAVVMQSTPDNIRLAFREAIAESGAPYVFSPGCEIPPDTPDANFAALCEPYYFEQAGVNM